MALYRDEAVVLRTHKLGEADRIVVLFTEGRGKVRAVAKGVRKTKSRFGGRLEPGSNIAIQLYEGREHPFGGTETGRLDTITQAETIEAHRAIYDDLGRLGDAMALLEAVDQVSQEREVDTRLYRMLQGALRTLAERRSPLLVAGFYWKMLALEGMAPQLDACIRCQTPLEAMVPVGVDVAEGGVVCRSCRSNGGRVVPISPDALALIGRILGGDLVGALAEPAGPATSLVADLATVTLEAHLERRLRSVRMLPH
jgi:DNA repair protein RecO (recombination protein O)